MKTLYLIRHAKSDWTYEHLPDIDRCLNKRGYDDAHKMGERMLERKMIPQLIVSSPAIRAISTALIIAREIGYAEDKIQLAADLYECGTDKYLQKVYETSDRVDSLAIVGHNPLISEAANQLSGAFLSFPTCCVAVIELKKNHWKEFASFKATMREALIPKELT